MCLLITTTVQGTVGFDHLENIEGSFRGEILGSGEFALSLFLPLPYSVMGSPLFTQAWVPLRGPRTHPARPEHLSVTYSSQEGVGTVTYFPQQWSYNFEVYRQQAERSPVLSVSPTRLEEAP